MLQQIDQGGNAAFDEYLSWFLDLIQTNQPTVL